MSNFNEAHEWLLIAYCFENPFSKNIILEDMTSVILAKVSWNVGNWYTTNWCPYKIVMPHTMIFFTFMPQSFYKLKNFTLLASLSTAINPNFMINLSNHCSDIVIWTSWSLGQYFGLKVLMCWKQVKQEPFPPDKVKHEIMCYGLQTHYGHSCGTTIKQILFDESSS